ncbi:MAG: AAA family ATPase [Bacteroidota bacterium]
MRMRRIAILGPESTGKTWLSERLAAHFGCKWVKEFARDYLSTLNHPYTLEDVVHCREEQLKAEDKSLKDWNGRIFFDTDATINFAVWLDEKYGFHPTENDLTDQPRYDCYLLTAPDLPFEPDPLRENPHKREHLFNRYQKAIILSGIPYRIVSGTGDERLNNAIAALHELEESASTT